LKHYIEIVRLVWPLALGMVNSAVMQAVDRAFLARYSVDALAAVLPATSLAWVFLSFFQSVVGYSGVFVAQYHGAKDEAGCRRSFAAAIYVSLIALVPTELLKWLGVWILSRTAATPEMFAMERAYFEVTVIGAACIYPQMAAISYLTGRGRTRLVFWIGLIGNVINIALDPLFIFGCPSFGISAGGVAGAAWATLLSLFVQCVLLMFVVWSDGVCEGFDAARNVMRALVWRLLRFGVPSGAYDVLNMLSFAIFVFVTGELDGEAFAASNACFTINYLLFAPMTGFAVGVQTLVGQARGRGDDAGAHLALRRTMILGLGFVFVACLAVLVLRDPILSLYASPDLKDPAAFRALGTTLLCLMSAWMLFDAADVILSGALKGAGDTRFVMVWMLVNAFLIWLPLVFVVRAVHDTMPALWGTMIVYVVIISAGSLVRWRRGKWRAINLIHAH
jgi:multidrug resistance protein, MATE family